MRDVLGDERDMQRQQHVRVRISALRHCLLRRRASLRHRQQLVLHARPGDHDLQQQVRHRHEQLRSIDRMPRKLRDRRYLHRIVDLRLRR
jgi:hypothetical protein